MSDEKNSFEKSSRKDPSVMGKKPVAAVGGVSCLRCHNEIESYVFTKFAFGPYTSTAGNVVLECSHCGHIEWMSQNSPLLRRLNAKNVAVGDGD
jgi:hypothetical protein